MINLKRIHTDKLCNKDLPKIVLIHLVFVTFTIAEKKEVKKSKDNSLDTEIHLR